MQPNWWCGDAKADGDDGVPLNAEKDHLLKPKSSIGSIRVLSNDSVHSSENFEHTTTVTVSGDSGATFSHPAHPDDVYHWFQEISGSSSFTTLENGAESEVTFEGFAFRMDIGRRAYYSEEGCAALEADPPEFHDNAIMQWGLWSGGTVTIENEYGTTVIEDVYFIGGLIIDPNPPIGEFGQGTGFFVNDGWSFQMALPVFDGFQEEQTIDGDGLLVFNAPGQISFVAQPEYGEVEITAGGTVLYSPYTGSEGVDVFEYRIMTQLGDTDSARVSIGTMDLDISDLNGSELSESLEDQPGLFLSVNNDDDNENQKVDLLDSGFVDNDLAKLRIKERAPSEIDLAGGYFTVSFGNKVNLWHSNDKKKPSNHSASQVVSGITRFAIDDLHEDFVLWVEGANWGTTTIDLVWHRSGVGALYDSVKVTVVGIDVDIDSDNDATIEHDDWEEELENHPFALGKLLFSDNEEFTEVKVKLPPGLSTSLRVAIKGKIIEGGSSGYVEILDQNKQYLGRTNFSGELGVFSLERLFYSAANGGFSLFVRRPLAVYSPPTKKDADARGKPDNRLEVKVQFPHGQPISDEVKLLVVREQSFFHMVHMMSHLRQAGASEAVYGGGTGSGGQLRLDDGKIFTMRYIPLEEMEEILKEEAFSRLPMDLKVLAKAYIYSYLYNSRPNGVEPEKPSSFQAGLYRNYVTGGYSLAIRGTELNSISEAVNDWITNLMQGLTGDDPSYDAGVLLSWALKSMDFFTGKEFRLTGHSMGGGIASAAAVTNSIPADVFNSAGVHPGSLVQDNGDPIIPGTNPTMDDAVSLITHFYIEYAQDRSVTDHYNTPDVLTFLSTHVAAMPKPPGRLVPIEGLHNLERADLVEDAIPKLLQLPENPFDLDAWAAIMSGINFAWYLGTDIGEMIDSHGLEHIFFGLLHNDDENDRWNAYEQQDPTLL